MCWALCLLLNPGTCTIVYWLRPWTLDLNFLVWNLADYYYYYFIFRATPMTYRISLPRGRIGAVTASLTPQPEQCGIWAISVTYTTAHGNAKSFNPLSEARDWTCVLMDNSRGRFCWTTRGTLKPYKLLLSTNYYHIIMGKLLHLDVFIYE